MLEYRQLEQTSVKFVSKFYSFIQENAFENVVYEMAAILSRPQCVDESAAFVGVEIKDIGLNVGPVRETLIKELWIHRHFVTFWLISVPQNWKTWHDSLRILQIVKIQQIPFILW